MAVSKGEEDGEANDVDKAEEVESKEEDDDDDDEDEEDDDSEEETSSEESSSDEEKEPVKLPSETLIQGRSQRRTAGKRMADLLDEEEDENFYKEMYGDTVFDDSNSDFDAEAEESWDELDTDFDEEEDEADDAGQEEPDEELKKKKRVYMDPMKTLTNKRKRGAPKGVGIKKASTPAAKRPKIVAPAQPVVTRKSTRKATTATEEKLAKAKQPQKRTRAPVKKLTQAERLREAVKTERLNAESLFRFRRKEAEKKKAVLRKTTFKGPVIQYISKTVTTSDGKKECRNYVGITDKDQFLKYFPHAASSRKQLH
eukprot:m.112831 g.112831  ORF g.112831 m.112831 type:complete len:313 (-) comp14105_c0_seq9:125-1063(-)